MFIRAFRWGFRIGFSSGLGSGLLGGAALLIVIVIAAYVAVPDTVIKPSIDVPPGISLGSPPQAAVDGP